jgi:hypothetical protein
MAAERLTSPLFVRASVTTAVRKVVTITVPREHNSPV